MNEGQKTKSNKKLLVTLVVALSVVIVMLVAILITVIVLHNQTSGADVSIVDAQVETSTHTQAETTTSTKSESTNINTETTATAYNAEAEAQQQKILAEKNDQLLDEYYNRNYSPIGETLVKADVTGDGFNELILIYIDSKIHGYVYSVSDSQVVLLEEKTGGASHIEGFFSWYLLPDNDGNGYSLVEEKFGMWQGMGTLSTVVYKLTPSGERNVLNTISVSSSSDNPVSDYEMKNYKSSIADVISSSYELYSTYTESGVSGMSISQMN